MAILDTDRNDSALLKMFVEKNYITLDLSTSDYYFLSGTMFTPRILAFTCLVVSILYAMPLDYI
jgi:hypothetical protein